MHSDAVIMMRALLKKTLPHSLFRLLRSLYARRRRSLSQMGQDFWVFGEVFNEKKNGYFLEVGSADGIFLNNTFLLEKRYSWKGICIEPDPSLYKDLCRVRTVPCLNVCVDSDEREVDFVQRDVLGGIVSDDTDNKPQDTMESGSNIIRLRTVTLQSILKAHNAPRTIDYCSVDIEGTEDRVLSDFPFEEYQFNCMTVERPKSRLRDVLARNGYIAVKEIPNHDVFYIHRSFYAEYERNIFNFWAKHSR